MLGAGANDPGGGDDGSSGGDGGDDSASGDSSLCTHSSPPTLSYHPSQELANTRTIGGYPKVTARTQRKRPEPQELTPPASKVTARTQRKRPESQEWTQPASKVMLPGLFPVASKRSIALNFAANADLLGLPQPEDNDPDAMYTTSVETLGRMLQDFDNLRPKRRCSLLELCNQISDALDQHDIFLKASLRSHQILERDMKLGNADLAVNSGARKLFRSVGNLMAQHEILESFFVEMLGMVSGIKCERETGRVHLSLAAIEHVRRLSKRRTATNAAFDHVMRQHEWMKHEWYFRLEKQYDPESGAQGKRQDLHQTASAGDLPVLHNVLRKHNRILHLAHL